MRVNPLRPISLVLAAAILLAAAAWFLHGHNIAVFDPAGPVAASERRLLYIGLGLALIVVLPVFSLLFIFAWKYHEDNQATYEPELDHSTATEVTWWLIPSIIIFILSGVAWNSSHSLDPFRPLASQAQTAPLSVQVIALQWKWLFIYPQQGVAAVNSLYLPVNRPVEFSITADAPMNSFWIPQLGGQVYAMPGMVTQLHLQAGKAGDYYGSSANISGQGFGSMHFMAHAVAADSFNKWAGDVKANSRSLTAGSYGRLANPSSNQPVSYFASADSSLFSNAVAKFMEPDWGSRP